MGRPSLVPGDIIHLTVLCLAYCGLQMYMTLFYRLPEGSYVECVNFLPGRDRQQIPATALRTTDMKAMRRWPLLRSCPRETKQPFLSHHLLGRRELLGALVQDRIQVRPGCDRSHTHALYLSHFTHSSTTRVSTAAHLGTLKGFPMMSKRQLKASRVSTPSNCAIR